MINPLLVKLVRSKSGRDIGLFLFFVCSLFVCLSVCWLLGWLFCYLFVVVVVVVFVFVFAFCVKLTSTCRFRNKTVYQFTKARNSVYSE